MRDILIRLGCAAVLSLGAAYYATANYTATQGTGTTFLDFIVSTVHIPAHVLVDAATGATDLGAAQLAAMQAPVPACSANPCATTIGNVGIVSQYPAGATAITASATGTTGATTATLAGTGGKTTYICGYSIRANATAAATVTNTITGVITATLSSIMWVAPLASGIGVDEQIFSPCIPASATNTGIAIVSGAPGSGGTVSSRGWGYQL